MTRRYYRQAQEDVRLRSTWSVDDVNSNLAGRRFRLIYQDIRSFLPVAKRCFDRVACLIGIENASYVDV